MQGTEKGKGPAKKAKYQRIVTKEIAADKEISLELQVEGRNEEAILEPG